MKESEDVKSKSGSNQSSEPKAKAARIAPWFDRGDAIASELTKHAGNQRELTEK